MDYTFVSTAWLESMLDQSTSARLRIVDIRGHVAPATAPLPHYFNHHADYLVSHLPQAVFVDWVHEITDPADPRHAKIAPPARYTEVMRRLGIEADTLVVAYDDANGMFAARLYWSLNYYGHSRVAVLQGGWQKWIAEGRPTTVAIPTITPSQFVAQPQPHLIRTAEQVAHRHGDSLLIDVRTVGEFRGEASRAARFGHIPGAINLPRTELLTKEGLPLSGLEIRNRLQIEPPLSEMICYCNGGVSASYGFLALRDAGYDNVAIYDGSWKEWGNDESKPIE